MENLGDVKNRGVPNMLEQNSGEMHKRASIWELHTVNEKEVVKLPKMK